MPWDSSRRVPWKRLLTFEGMYAGLFAAFLVVFERKNNQMAGGLIALGVAVVATTVLISVFWKFGWNPAFLKSRLELQQITKQFPGVLANDRISISVDKGQVLGLLGENGAGKTTLMNILSGLYSPDSGEILIDGEPRRFHDPADAIRAGIGMVHQHFMLVPVFDVVESVALGAETTSGPLGSPARVSNRRRGGPRVRPRPARGCRTRGSARRPS